MPKKDRHKRMFKQYGTGPEQITAAVFPPQAQAQTSDKG